MASQSGRTVSESTEGVLTYLFYTAGAVAGLTSGLLEISARLLVAGLHAKFATRTCLDALKNPQHSALEKQPAQSSKLQAKQKSSPWLSCFVALEWLKAGFTARTGPSSPEPPTTPNVEDPLPPSPTDVSGSSSADGSEVKSLPSAPPVDASWTCPNTADRCSTEEVDASNSASDGSRAVVTTASAPAEENPKTMGDAQAVGSAVDIAEGAANAAPADAAAPQAKDAVELLPEDAEAAVVGLDRECPAAEAEVNPAVAAEVGVAQAAAAEQEADPAAAVDEEEPLTEGFIAPAPVSDKACGTASPCASTVQPGSTAVAPDPAEEPAPEPISEVAPQPDQSPLPSRFVAGALGCDETRSESAESGITAVSYGTVNSVDASTGAPMSRWPKAATASGAAASTPGMSYAQRLEEKRKSTRRKGAHTAKAR